jgi:hypothetical protein
MTFIVTETPTSGSRVTRMRIVCPRIARWRLSTPRLEQIRVDGSVERREPAERIEATPRHGETRERGPVAGVLCEKGFETCAATAVILAIHPNQPFGGALLDLVCGGALSACPSAGGPVHTTISKSLERIDTSSVL